MCKKLVLLLLTVFVAVINVYGDNNRFVLVIDAGHGGKDAGALGAFSKEKNINLNVALAFGRYVEQNCPDVKVIYTRKTDVFVELNERANIANRNKADLFVSIHTNALPEGRIARGLETYTMGMARAKSNLDVAKRENAVILVEKDYKQRYEGFNPNSSESYIMFEFMQDKYMKKSVDMAKFVQSEVCTVASRPNKGIHQAGFLVLRCTTMPSCLIELGFITTPDEERFLNSDNGIDLMGKGIYQAFLKYKNSTTGGFTVPYKADTPSSVTIPTIVKKDEETVATAAVAEKTPEPEKIIKADEKNDAPVFKVQIFTCSRALRPDSQQFKGQENVDSYQDNGMVKYTCGASTDYNEIYQLRKKLLDKFPEAFIVAFKGNQRVDVVAAIKEFKQNKDKQ